MGVPPRRFGGTTPPSHARIAGHLLTVAITRESAHGPAAAVVLHWFRSVVSYNVWAVLELVDSGLMLARLIYKCRGYEEDLLIFEAGLT
jgi:hypothetical protein